jgi:aspartate aminotransferase, mitochondrial
MHSICMQGFASGDCERDGAAVKLFLNKGLPMALSQSYAKNMGMYGQVRFPRVLSMSAHCQA